VLPKEFLTPGSVAVVGASRNPEKVGFGVFANLLQAGFPGPVYGVNPSGGELLGRQLYESLDAIPGPVDLGVFVVPPKAILTGIPPLARKGMKAAIAITAGFKEVGGEGVALEKALAEVAAAAGIRILGPNCLGLINTHASLNASFSRGIPPRGGISFFSQSGALCTAVLDWAVGENVGFSKFVSLGNKTDISESDVMECLADDPETRVILGYVESIDDGRRFVRVARGVTRRKPVVLLKAGSTAAGARAASSHTGSLAGSDRAYSAAFRQAGIVRAGTVEELFDLAVGFAMQPVPSGERLLVLTNAGGPGILAADAAERMGIPLAEITGELRARLSGKLPPTAGLANPVDIIGDARADRYRDALAVVRDEPSVDVVLVLLTPQAMTDSEETARAVVSAFSGTGKAVFASFLGEATVAEARRILSSGGVPNYPVPERAVRAVHGLLRYGRLRQAEMPEEAEAPAARPPGAERAIRAALSTGRRTMGEEEARGILEAYGFAFPRRTFADTSDAAVEAFRELGGGRAVMKIVSPDVLHKTDVGGVRLSLATEADVSRAFVEITSAVRRKAPSAWIAGVSVQEMVEGGREIVLGLIRDTQFGPLLMFGIGGIYVEVLKDVTFRMAPLTRRDAQEMVREIRSYPLLASFRGDEPADEEAVVEALLRLSRLATDFPEIQELDVNPLLVLRRGKGVRAIDCRMTIAEVP
jgi:acetyltransferase